MKSYLRKLDEAENIEAKRKIAKEFSKEYVKVEIGPHSTLEDYRSTILYFYFRNFYDEETFVGKHFRSAALASCQSTDERSEIMGPNPTYNFTDAKNRMRYGFKIYTNPSTLPDFFANCQKAKDKSQEAKSKSQKPKGNKEDDVLPIGVEISLNVILATVVRCYLIEVDAFSNASKLIEEQDLLSVNEFGQVCDLSSIDAIFNKFCTNNKGNHEYNYITELINDTFTPGDQGLGIKKSKEEAVEEFKSTFNQMKNTSLYLISFDSSVVTSIDFLGITLYSKKMLVVDCSESFSGYDLSLWYTFVLVHELCHLQRLEKANFDVEQFTPEKWTNEAGINMELELFGKVLHADKLTIEKLKAEGSPLKKVFRRDPFRGSMGCRIPHSKIKLELFKKFIEKQ